MFSRSQNMISGGTFINQNLNSKGMDILMEWIATGAFHNSNELYGAAECHPHTRVAVLDNIMQWVGESGSAQDDFMLWLFGPAGAGKTAIAKRIAQIAAERDLLIADFFFSRTSPTRNNKDRLIATLAYQLAVSIPDTRSYIEDAIVRDPVIFNKNILTQINTLLIKPLQSVSSTPIYPSQKLIIIDGLDECNDSQAQAAILEAISRSFPLHNLPIKILVVSRPELNLVTSFSSHEPLKSIHRRLALDDTYQAYNDIHLFLSDKFEHIKLTHPLRSTIPISWPTRGTLRTLVEKSSGQFIYASTVVKFVESINHRPTARLNVILGLSPPGRMNPFAELDALYNHLLSSVDDIQLVLRVLSLYAIAPRFAPRLRDMTPELFLSLEPGDIQLALTNLSSIATYHESSGTIKFLHASFVDFLADRRRSTIFYIDKASTYTDFVHRILQYVKGPDGTRAGDIDLFHGVISLSPWVRGGELRGEILNFDLDAFINASIKWQYEERPVLVPGSTITAFNIWTTMLDDARLEDRDKKQALHRINKSFKSRLQIYQSCWRLQLLLTFAVTEVVCYGRREIPYCKCLDILLETDDHDFHLADQKALDLRHAYGRHGSILPAGLQPPYVDRHTYASAALHCMRFISNLPKYSERSNRNGCSEMRLIYAEWKATYEMTLDMLCELLQQAHTSLELVQFISKNDIHPGVQKNLFADRVLDLNAHILAFLNRASVCVNWRIISAIRQSLFISDQLSSKSEENSARLDEQEDSETASRIRLRHNIDQCCNHTHYSYI